jgi:hypothetical protein
VDTEADDAEEVVVVPAPEHYSQWGNGANTKRGGAVAGADEGG